MKLLAVSGGADSMCLMEKVRLEGGPFAVAHCNFHLRGAESDADEALVRDYCAGYGITLHVKDFDTETYASERGVSIEMAARELRYRWFGELCREHGYESVMVAHNAQDNAETLILNLLRGTGPKGIVGMKPSGFLPVPEYVDIPLERPLLGLTREEIIAFNQEHSVPWREDSTNLENGYKRNKIRNLVFPVFREINPSFIRTLNKDMERFAQAFSPLLEEGFTPEPSGASPLRPSHSPAGSGPLPLMRPRVATGSGVNTSSDGDKAYNVTEEEWDGSEDVKQPEGVLIMDAEKVGEMPEFSFWKEGDWIRPLGAPGKKKLQDWFTDHHVPLELKHIIPLVRDPEEPSHILAIAGYCIDKKVKVGPSTRRIYRVLPVTVTD